MPTAARGAEGVEAVTGSLHLKQGIGGAFCKAPVLCVGCSSQHARKVTGRDNSALGSSVVRLASRAGHSSAPLAPGGRRGGFPPLSQSLGEGTGMPQLEHTCTDTNATLLLPSSFSLSPEPGAVWLGTAQQIQPGVRRAAAGSARRKELQTPQGCRALPAAPKVPLSPAVAKGTGRAGGDPAAVCGLSSAQERDQR